MISPFKGKKFQLTSIYQKARTLDGVTKPHNGIDLVGIDSKEIAAIAPGTVVRSMIITDKNNPTWAWGNYVAIKQTDGNVCYYCHMKERKVKVGQKVNKGDVLGIEGNTGYVWSSWGGPGNHLHLEIRNAAGVPFNVADYIGIKNQTGIYTVAEPAKTFPTTAVTIADKVCQICGLEQQTKDYLNQYKYATDLWQKIYNKLIK